MQKHNLSKRATEAYLPTAGDLCKAMFIEGARVLGFTLEAPIPREAQERILQAADLLANGLTVLLGGNAGADPEGEVYH
jgi:hypothetical protein